MTGRKIPYYTVDAFTDTPFRGNPAAVCLDIDGPSDQAMARIAGEMNLSETAFVYEAGDGGTRRLRWFTPAVEVPLRGHATLAGAHVLPRERGAAGPVRFDSLSGPLIVHEEGVRAWTFPRTGPPRGRCRTGWRRRWGSAARRPSLPHPERSPCWCSRRRTSCWRCGPTSELGRVAPPGGAMGIAVAAPADDAGVDFVSRFFAPWVGVDEDPVTGVAHTTLTPWWSAVLGRREMEARQRSARGGALTVRERGDRVELVGHAATVAKGGDGAAGMRGAAGRLRRRRPRWTRR